jgi:hypothetical protein
LACAHDIPFIFGIVSGGRHWPANVASIRRLSRPSGRIETKDASGFAHLTRLVSMTLKNASLSDRNQGCERLCSSDLLGFDDFVEKRRAVG